MKKYFAVLMLIAVASIENAPLVAAGPLVSSGSAISLVAVCASDTYKMTLLESAHGITASLVPSADPYNSLASRAVQVVRPLDHRFEKEYVAALPKTGVFDLKVQAPGLDTLREATLDISLQDGMVLNGVPLQCQFSQDLKPPQL